MSVENEITEILHAYPEGKRRRDLFRLCESAVVDLEISVALKKLEHGSRWSGGDQRYSDGLLSGNLSR